MSRILFWTLSIALAFGACKSADTPSESSSTSSTVSQSQEAPSSLNDKSTTVKGSTLSEEAQYQFQAFVKQGDAQYEAGAYREALDFYKKAQALAPDQIDKAKMIACIKALQEPSTREGL